jgi:hypothetical protein
MALGFFRKWQKMIIVIMVVLMLSFLVGSTGMRILCAPGSHDFARGESKYGKLMQRGQIDWAEQDLRNLATFLQLHGRSAEFMQLNRNGNDYASVAYALLLQEARSAGHEASEADVEDYLASIGLQVDGAEYGQLLTRINTRKSGTTEPAIRAALGRWVMVLRSYQAYQVSTPPSETYLRKLFRDLSEKLTLRILEVPAGKYKSLVAAPTAEQIKKQFDSYRALRPGVYPRGDSFGFGYAQPARVSVAYLLVNSDVIARVTRPDDRTVRDYFRENAATFTKEVPVTTQPVTPTTGPGATTQPKIRTRSVQMTLDEAWEQIVDRIAGQAAEAKTEEFLQLIQTNVEAQMGRVASDPDLYKKVYGRMIDGSQVASVLSKMVRADDISALRGQTLAVAIPALARAAGLEAICYPWETSGEFSVSKDVRVPKSLQADGPRTLGAVLDDITRLVFSEAHAAASTQPATTKPASDEAIPAAQYPKLKWTSCRGLAKVLFPVSGDEGMTLLPITTGRTALVDARGLSGNSEIGRSQSSRKGRGKWLAALAMKASPFKSGQVMYTFSGNAVRRVLWQVIKSQPAGVLKTPTAEVQKKVIEDCKILAGYMTPAMKTAEAIAQKARTVGLEAAAESEKMETILTDPVSRLTAISPAGMVSRRIMQQAYMGGLPEGVNIQEYMSQIQAYAAREAMPYKPYEYPVSRVRTAKADYATPNNIDLKTTEGYKRFIERVFELVPEDIEKPIAPGPLGPVITIPMPTARAHFVVQRVGYTPAVGSDFKDGGRKELLDQALANAAWNARVGFFTYGRIVQRVEYKDRAQQQSSDKK